MAELIEVPFKGGNLVFAAAGSDGAQAYSAASAVIRATETLDEILDTIKSLGSTMAEKLAGIEFAQAEASFGIKFTGKGKFIVAEASA